MSVRYDLSRLKWTVAGWDPWQWRAALSMELGTQFVPQIPFVPARVPGSVQRSLRDAGLLPDWNVGNNARACEWVENRHWQFQTTLPNACCRKPGRKLLLCEGLDYQGTVLINGKSAGEFRGTFTPHKFDLTALVAEDNNSLSIVFTDNPRNLGQICFTSQIAEWKARFNYGWDWCPRLVQIGIWGPITMVIDDGNSIDALSVQPRYDAQTGRGEIRIRHSSRNAANSNLLFRLTDANGAVIREATNVGHQSGDFAISDIHPAPWNPNGNGTPNLYELAVKMVDSTGRLLDEEIRRIGFRQVEWKSCKGAPPGADPWICCVNGRDTFLQGINWTPILPNFADVTEAEYRARLTLYRDMGINILRVWGGAMLEMEMFYLLCDELGIMVWQEFPLSSSGLDNWPPENPSVISEAVEIAKSYISRRQHHASLIMWCGGNELQGSHDGGKTGIGKPVDRNHPMMAELARVVAEMDPQRRFVPTSSSGPNFMADERQFGKGVHHDVHGPWNRPVKWEDWIRYWDHDDALFRSETGCPSASPADILRSLAGDKSLPASHDNALWRSLSQWWIQWDEYLSESGDPESLDSFVNWSQNRQAEALTYAVSACKHRFPACGGIILWMGHDCFPCPANTSIVDFLGRPKHAAIALTQVWRSARTASYAGVISAPLST